MPVLSWNNRVRTVKITLMQLNFLINQKIGSLLFLYFLPKWILWFLSFAAKIYYLKVNYLLKFCGDMNPAVWISFLTNLWLENKSSFFSFSAFVICVLYMPLGPFINYLCLLRSDSSVYWHWIVFWVCHQKIGVWSKVEKDFFTSFYYGTLIAY